MTSYLAIDPGPTESAYVVIDGYRMPSDFGKVDNHELFGVLDQVRQWGPTLAGIEMVSSYGMPVGVDVFETCVWTGRFYQYIEEHTFMTTDLIKRQEVKLHHCHDSRAKDGNIIQALVDRFTPGETNRGKGTKANPGWFHGFAGDIWQAYALAVYMADRDD